MSEDETLKGVGVVALFLVLAWLLWWMEDRRSDLFRECMNAKHDKFICEPYSRRGR